MAQTRSSSFGWQSAAVQPCAAPHGAVRAGSWDSLLVFAMGSGSHAVLWGIASGSNAQLLGFGSQTALDGSRAAL